MLLVAVRGTGTKAGAGAGAEAGTEVKKLTPTSSIFIGFPSS